MRPGAAALVRTAAAVLGSVLYRPTPTPAPISLAAQRQWLLRHGFLHSRSVPPRRPHDAAASAGPLDRAA